MAVLNIVNTVDMVSFGTQVLGKHGAATNARWKPVTLSSTPAIAGTVHERLGVLAGGAAATIFDGAGGDDLPVTFNYGWFWCDAAGQLQLIDDDTTGSNVIVEIIALVPFTFAATMLAAADETAITDGATTLRNIDKLVFGSTAGGNYHLILVD